jgi:hypothetical protein
MESMMSTLLARVERLESANRRLRGFVMAAFAVFALFGFTAATTTSGGPIIVKGTNGRSVHIQGDYIAFEDSTGSSRLSIGLTDAGDSMVDVRDRNGKTRARFGMTSAGSALLSLFDSAGTERTYVGSFTDGSYGASFYDRSGTERAYLGLSSKDNPQMRLKDGSKNDRLFMGTYSDGTYGATVYDASGGSIWHS